MYHILKQRGTSTALRQVDSHLSPVQAFSERDEAHVSETHAARALSPWGAHIEMDAEDLITDVRTPRLALSSALNA